MSDFGVFIIGMGFGMFIFYVIHQSFIKKYECERCGEEKIFNNFIDPNNINGRSICKKCMKKLLRY